MGTGGLIGQAFGAPVGMIAVALGLAKGGPRAGLHMLREDDAGGSGSGGLPTACTGAAAAAQPGGCRARRGTPSPRPGAERAAGRRIRGGARASARGGGGGGGGEGEAASD